MNRTPAKRTSIPRPVKLAPVLLALTLLAVAGGASRPALAGTALPALQPPTTGGLAAVDRGLARLSTHRRLLVIAAHPDDEDTSLLTLVSRGLGGEAAYLSLSRGEGGQNLIGPELGVGLGLIRSRELLAAREIDGGRQFFTRAYDFGFTRSLEETLKRWPREVLLADAVRGIRRFKPQVVVSIFPPSEQAGHGQHQAAGVIAPEAFRAAGDPEAFPDLTAEGLAPWQPAAFYRSAFFDREAATAVLPIGRVDPLTGKSIYQLAMASRSMHRSQDMGRLQELGAQETRVSWVEGGAGREAKDLWGGVDTSLAAMAAPLGDSPARREVAKHLAAAGELAVKTRAALSPEKAGEAVGPLAEILTELRAARGKVPGDAPEGPAVAALIEEKIGIAESALAAAAGIAVDATTEREGLIAGEDFPVRAVLWSSGAEPLSGVRLHLAAAAEWGGDAAEDGPPNEVPPAGLSEWKVNAHVPAGAPVTLPYFLRRPLQGDLYDWSAATPTERGEPFEPPPLLARFTFTVRGVEVALDREVVHLHRDQALGEIRRPLRVVPAVEVELPEHLLVWPLGLSKRANGRRLEVTLDSHSRDTLLGRLEAALPAPWPAIAPAAFRLEPEGEATVVIEIGQPPATLPPGRYDLRLAAVLPDGRRFETAVPIVDYPHIRPTPRPEPATVAVSAADLKLPPLARVGYVRGASDRVPEYVRQAGVPLSILGREEMLAGDLSGYDAIVIGSRAYETDPALIRANARLLDYTRKGGLLLVQYQQYPFIDGKLAPLALEIARPHDRVTDETAAVTVLAPESSVFNLPNRIGPADWEGWVQERGLYFAHTWDPAFTPLLAMADPGGPEQRGGLLVAKLGEGTYVYTGLAFFRQLPAGVPGAYRLFANLLGLAKPPGKGGKKP